MFGDMDIYLFCDGSPQWRGAELFAASMDILFNDAVKRILLPLLSLPRDHLDRVGKCVALLWQLLMLVGSRLLQAFLKRVRGILTDCGVERLIADMPEFLVEFFAYCRVKVPLGFQSAPGFLFPRCIHMPGWRHNLDLIIRKALTSMRAFPIWITRLKAVIHLLRDVNLRDQVCRCLKKKKVALVWLL